MPRVTQGTITNNIIQYNMMLLVMTVQGIYFLFFCYYRNMRTTMNNDNIIHSSTQGRHYPCFSMFFSQ